MTEARVIEAVIEASLMDWYHPSAREHRRYLATELQRVRRIDREALSVMIMDGYRHARNHGGTMYMAADAAADAILALIRGENGA